MSATKSVTIRLSEKTKTILDAFANRYFQTTGELLTNDQAVLRAIEAADPGAVELGKQVLDIRSKKTGNGKSKRE